uniref:Uncharacterized protein n=1 Tax=Oncorhynchus tshawytscha TaxID=74940 RepID=A0A8C8FZN1_ONCTS
VAGARIDCNPPPNFSWVEPIKLARLALPQMTSYYLYLLDNCIRHLKILRFMSIGVAVYCIHGHGRTGTMLAKTRKISVTDEIRRAQITVHVDSCGVTPKHSELFIQVGCPEL